MYKYMCACASLRFQHQLFQFARGRAPPGTSETSKVPTYPQTKHDNETGIVILLEYTICNDNKYNRQQTQTSLSSGNLTYKYYKKWFVRRSFSYFFTHSNN